MKFIPTLIGHQGIQNEKTADAWSKVHKIIAIRPVVVAAISMIQFISYHINRIIEG